MSEKISRNDRKQSQDLLSSLFVDGILLCARATAMIIIHILFIYSSSQITVTIERIIMKQPSFLFRVRTVTAFLSLQPSDFAPTTNRHSHDNSSRTGERCGIATKVSLATRMIRDVEQALVDAGYEIQTLRMATNPFGEWMYDNDDNTAEKKQTLSPDDRSTAQSRLEQLDALLEHHAIQFCAVGPAQNLAELHFCPTIIATSPRLSCSATVAAGDVVTASAVAQSIQTIARLEQLQGLGNFRFCAAAATCRALIPFFPAAQSTSIHVSSSSSEEPNTTGELGFALGLENGALAKELLQQAGSISKIRTHFCQDMARAVKPLQGKCKKTSAAD
jgi:hypothetical protein